MKVIARQQITKSAVDVQTPQNCWYAYNFGYLRADLTHQNSTHTRTVLHVTTTNTNTPPIATPPPTGAVYLTEWHPDEDRQRFAHRWFHCAVHTTPGGLRVKAQGIQYADGSTEELAVAISDSEGNTVLVDADGVKHLAEQILGIGA